MELTEKLKKLLANPSIDCDAHEDCCTCPLSKYIKVIMPLGELESLGKGGFWSGNMPFGNIEFHIQPCMMFSEIIKKLGPVINDPDINSDIEGEDTEAVNILEFLKRIKPLIKSRISSPYKGPGKQGIFRENIMPGSILMYEINLGDLFIEDDPAPNGSSDKGG